MPEFITNSIETEEQGWPPPVTVRVRSTEPWWKCHRVILIAAIGCLIGWLSCHEPQSRFFAAFLGTLLANEVVVGVPRLVRWLPSRVYAVARMLYLPAYHRRRLQFRLRTLFVLVLFSGVALTGWNWSSPYRKARREQEAFIAAIEGLGGTVVSGAYGPSWYRVRAWHSVSFEGIALGNRDVAYLSTFPAAQTVTVCDLSSTLVTDAGLAHLAKWSQMKALTLNRCLITDQGIREYARIKTGGLNQLWIEYCRGITDGSVDDLLKLAPDILVIHGTAVTPNGAAMLQAHVWPRLPRTKYDPSNALTSPTRTPRRKA